MPIKCAGSPISNTLPAAGMVRIAKIEHSHMSIRVMWYQLKSNAAAVRQALLCPGDMENRIKENQLDMSAIAPPVNTGGVTRLAGLQSRRWPTASCSRSVPDTYKDLLPPGRESTRTRINPKRLKHSRVENTHGCLCLKNDFSDYCGNVLAARE